jgi:uncharacterized protein (DUF58 family)
VLTERGTGLILAAVALWIAARSFGVPELQMAAVAALVLVTLAVGYVTLNSANVAIDRVVRPGRLFFDAEAVVELRVTNIGRLPTGTLELRDQAALVLTDAPRLRVPPLRAGRHTNVSYRIRGGQRGRFDIGPATVRLRDPFGLVARRRTLAGTGTVVVYPPVWRLPTGIPLGGAATTGGEGRPRPMPSGEDLANVREYVRGDDLRAVHWASTAHRGKLMVRHTESREEPRAVLALDLRAERHRGAGPGASEEAAVAAAASIVAHLAARDRGIVLLHRPLTEPPRASERDELLAELAEVRTEGAVELPALLNQIAQGLAGGGTLFAVVTLPEAGELRQLVRAGRGFSTRVALLVDAASHAARPDPAADETAAALRAAGWRVVVLRAGDRLDQRWRDLLTQRRVAVPSGGAAR